MSPVSSLDLLPERPEGSWEPELVDFDVFDIFLDCADCDGIEPDLLCSGWL